MTSCLATTRTLMRDLAPSPLVVGGQRTLSGSITAQSEAERACSALAGRGSSLGGAVGGNSDPAFCVDSGPGGY